MSERETLPTPIVLNLTEVVDKEGPIVREVTLINTVISMANVALRQYDLEIIPSIDFRKEKE